MNPFTYQTLDSYRAAVADAEERLKALDAQRESLKLFVDSGKGLLVKFMKEATVTDKTESHVTQGEEFARLPLVKTAALYLRKIGRPQWRPD